ncbi:MAG: chemotaxis protein CheW [Gammaproteobacteria bacterium]|nr:chemotaxis protein CheW [Gammaproteobacteria bacterium]
MSANHALQLLRDIETATFRHAAPLPLRQDAHPQWQGMGYQVGGLRLVSAMGEISEVLKPPRVAALPGVKSWVLGVANIRGRLIPVIDLHEFLGIAPTLPMAQWRVLVVEDEEMIAGLLVEQSLGMQHFLEDSFEEASAEGLGALAPYVRGAFRHGGRVFYDAQLKWILRDEKFLDVAQQTN